MLAELAILLMLQMTTSEIGPAIQTTAEQGRCVDLGEQPDARVAPPPRIAPGPPPVLSFRYYEGKLHHRFGNSELLLDDAGH